MDEPDALHGALGRRVKVLVVDDDPIVRHALRAALETERPLEFGGEAQSAGDAVTAALELQPDVILLDAEISDGQGIATTTALKHRAPSAHIVLLAPSPDDDLGLLSLRAGASGFLPKDIAPSALRRAIRGVCAGEAAISRSLAGIVVDRLKSTAERGSGMRPVRSTLTSREWQALDLMCEGATTASMAETLGLSADTVRTHVKHVLTKLGAHSRAEAVAIAGRLRAGQDATPPGPPLDELTLRRIASRGARRPGS
jgi:two-component system nitrate/nitrite response regulator NarL